MNIDIHILRAQLLWNVDRK